MTEPQTKTGKRLWNNPDVVADLAGGVRRDDIIELEQEVFASTMLVDEEKKAMEHLFAASDIILGWGLKANSDELVQAVHVIQGFIVQHMLFRLNPQAWSRWYEKVGSSDG
jgi:hypothetical protein